MDLSRSPGRCYIHWWCCCACKQSHNHVQRAVRPLRLHVIMAQHKRSSTINTGNDRRNIWTNPLPAKQLAMIQAGKSCVKPDNTEIIGIVASLFGKHKPTVYSPNRTVSWLISFGFFRSLQSYTQNAWRTYMPPDWFMRGKCGERAIRLLLAILEDQVNQRWRCFSSRTF